MSASEIAAEEETAHLAPGGGCVSEGNSEAGDPAPQDPSREGGKAIASCHEREWKAATNVPDQRLRKGRPTGKFRNLPITLETTELEMFEELMPLSWMGLLGRLRVNAAHNRDRNTHTLNDVKPGWQSRLGPLLSRLAPTCGTSSSMAWFLPSIAESACRTMSGAR